MIYLLSQMILALVVAIVLGMALGWIIHRHLYNRVVHQFRHRLARQSAQLAQAETDVTMLSDDYDELRRQSQDEISALSADNQQIPSISQNLEKSQLLVQQMMKRHEAETRDLTNENKRLKDKIADLDKQAAGESSISEADQQKDNIADLDEQAASESSISEADQQKDNNCRSGRTGCRRKPDQRG